MFYFSRFISGDRLLCLAPLTNRLKERADAEPADDSGYFLFEQTGFEDQTRIRILAQVHSDEAALALKDMMQLA